MGNIPNIAGQTSPFINQDNVMAPLLASLGYITQARGTQFVEVS